MLARCGVGDTSYNEYAIPLHDSVDKVRAELRQTEYLLKPRESVEYLWSITGVYLHPDLVNFDMAALGNYHAFKAEMSGGSEMTSVKVYVLPDDSIDLLTKAELVKCLTALVSTSYSSQEHEVLLGNIRRAKTKPSLIALLRELETEED